MYKILYTNNYKVSKYKDFMRICVTKTERHYLRITVNKGHTHEIHCYIGS